MKKARRVLIDDPHEKEDETASSNIGRELDKWNISMVRFPTPRRASTVGFLTDRRSISRYNHEQERLKHHQRSTEPSKFIFFLSEHTETELCDNELLNARNTRLLRHNSCFAHIRNARFYCLCRCQATNVRPITMVCSVKCVFHHKKYKDWNLQKHLIVLHVHSPPGIVGVQCPHRYPPIPSHRSGVCSVSKQLAIACQAACLISSTKGSTRTERGNKE